MLTQAVRQMFSSASTPAAVRQARQGSQGPSIPIQHFNFQFDKNDLDSRFYFRTVLGSAYWQALSIFLTYGEDLVIETARFHRDLLTDPVLKQRVTSLIGQEAIHSKIHNEWNEILKDNRFPVTLYRFLADQVFERIFLKFPQPMKLSLMAAIEHFTAVIAQHMMVNNDTSIVSMMDNPETRTEDSKTMALWMWHMLEESEHKDIAYDVYQVLSGNYWLRVFGFVLALVTIVGLVSLGGVMLPYLRSPRHLISLKYYKDVKTSLKLLVGRKYGVFGSNWGHVFDYLRRDFHPNDHDTTEYLEYYKKYLLDPEDGLLTPYFVKEFTPPLRASVA